MKQEQTEEDLDEDEDEDGQEKLGQVEGSNSFLGNDRVDSLEDFGKKSGMKMKKAFRSDQTTRQDFNKNPAGNL